MHNFSPSHDKQFARVGEGRGGEGELEKNDEGERKEKVRKQNIRIIMSGELSDYKRGRGKLWIKSWSGDEKLIFTEDASP